MGDVIVRIADVVGAGICVDAADGQKVYGAIREKIIQKKRVIISFEEVTRVTTAFLNAAVGQLYGEFKEDEVREFMGPPIHADQHQLSRLKLVVERAKAYFGNPEKARESFSKITGMDKDGRD